MAQAKIKKILKKLGRGAGPNCIKLNLAGGKYSKKRTCQAPIRCIIINLTVGNSPRRGLLVPGPPVIIRCMDLPLQIITRLSFWGLRKPSHPIRAVSSYRLLGAGFLFYYIYFLSFKTSSYANSKINFSAFFLLPPNKFFATESAFNPVIMHL